MIKGGVAGSGMFDLNPVRLAARSNYVKFTDEVEENLSAQHHLDRLAAPVALVYGTAELCVPWCWRSCIAIEMTVVKMEQGWDRSRTATFAWTSTAFPMLTESRGAVPEARARVEHHHALARKSGGS